MSQTTNARLFRQHDVAPEVGASSIYRQLTQEWARLHSLPTTHTTVRRWTRTEPALAGLARPGDIVDAIDAGDNARKNELLLALLRLFQSGQQLAGRTVLQALLPKLARIAMSAVPESANQGDFVEDSRHLTIAEFWEVAATYPVARRTERVASNLALDTLNRVTRQRQHADPIPFDPDMLYGQRDASDSASGASDFVARRVLEEVSRAATPDRDPVDVVTPDTDLLTVIAWGIQTSAITRDEGQMLVTAYLPDKTEGWGFDDLCKQFGIPLATVRKRCSRAVKKLTDAVREEMSTSFDVSPNVVLAAA
ncbi:hypothetical protein Xcel_3434 (plasmid) [Xylanimonas cellulosilytica DSM 15894]|uniref:RNA polymerase, sigma-24 subunit, ECF subfamily n=1 Tax=Xylanimonas cellulosilytica (strain DSM 15894 / JCM 12276 / CECT 5975 / KCTC 9989 / LMG 20990 / NBRC 107835 / XIL07) TaxID=446471 RepID=D1C0W7_XYLCX|nr:hypothetical protein [Xylanimonas cellulosilytica]ACZ32433.1 hypothetical protein Xcel_3434 [Xylanimonas cellulosilytica DSM 15894]